MTSEKTKKRIPVIGLTGTRTCEKCGQLMKGRIFNGNHDYFVCLRCLEKGESIERYYKCNSKR